MQKIFLKKLEAFLKKSKSKENIYVVLQHIGYKKDLENKNKLIVDYNVADIVKKIFDMYVNGTGSKLIVEYLNKNHYLSPSGYRKTGIVQDENKFSSKSLISCRELYASMPHKIGYNWNATTLCNMLKNEVYIGNTIQNKISVVSYKVKKLRKVEKEKHIRVNNTHEAIIDKEVFEKAQMIHKDRSKKVVKHYDYLLRGLIYCKHCRLENANCIKGKSPLQSPKDSIYCRYRLSKKRLLCKKFKLSKV